jgi:cytochrome c biogenesis protein ResB
VLRRFDNALVSWSIEPVERKREARIPALLVEVTGQEQSSSVWVQKYDRRRVVLEGTPYELRFDDKRVPLGFALTLNQFHIGHYPGTRRPRSFESHVTIRDPASGREQDRIIWMNHPTKHGGYALFQSNYDLAGGRRTSILSVSRDPGLPVVYAGYVAMMVGMVVVLVTRALERRRAAQRPTATAVLER